MPMQKAVLDLEDKYSKLTDEELKAKTPELKERLKNGESLDDLVDQMLESFDPDDFNVTETKEAQYKIEDNKVKMTGEDALGYFVYDEAKGGLVIGTDDTSDQSKNMVKLLSGIVLKKK